MANNMIEAVIENITKNSIFPIKVFEQTIQIHYEGKWYSLNNIEQDMLLIIKPLIEKSLNYEQRVTSSNIKTVYEEIKIEYQKLDNYISDDGIFINLADIVIKINKDGTIEKLKHNPYLGFRWQLPFPYNKDEKCPRLMNFLNEAIGEQEAIQVLQEYMGYVFLPHSYFNLEKSLWLSGLGANGKSVFTSILKFVYGEENISYLDLPELNDSEKRTMLKGKVLNISQDATNRIGESSYKTIVSGEKLLVRELYKGSCILNSVPKLVVSLNEMPTIKNGLDAFIRRTIIVPFNNVVPEHKRDIHLSSKLKEEIAGIFNFAIVGLQRLLQQKHFTKSKLISDAISTYKGELDVINDFLNDNPLEVSTKTEGHHILQADLFKKLSDYCKTNGIKNTYTSPRKFTNELIAKYNFPQYKNDKLYGIRAKWSNHKIVSGIDIDSNQYLVD